MREGKILPYVKPPPPLPPPPPPPPPPHLYVQQIFDPLSHFI